MKHLSILSSVQIQTDGCTEFTRSRKWAPGLEKDSQEQASWACLEFGESPISKASWASKEFTVASSTHIGCKKMKSGRPIFLPGTSGVFHYPRGSCPHRVHVRGHTWPETTGGESTSWPRATVWGPCGKPGLLPGSKSWLGGLAEPSIPGVGRDVKTLIVVMGCSTTFPSTVFEGGIMACKSCSWYSITWKASYKSVHRILSRFDI